jgi:hypothetical protein
MGLYGGSVRDRNRLEDTEVDERIILKWIFSKKEGDARNGFIWFNTCTFGGLLLMRQ